MHAQVNYWASR